MLKSYGWGGGWGEWGGGPCDFSVSPRSKYFLFPFWGNFYTTWDMGLDSDLDKSLTIFNCARIIY